MDTIYIFLDGELKRKDNTLYIEPKDNNKNSLHIPLKNVSSLMFFSEVTLNKRLLHFFAKEEIPAYFYDYYGNYIGAFYPREMNKIGLTMIKQYENYINKEKRLIIAKKFVEGSSENMIKVLENYKKQYIELEKIINLMKSLQNTVDSQNNINAVMSIEGNIRKNYYNGLGIILNKNNFSFEQRTKKPPKDEINAMISFGNVILYNITLAEIYQTSLDPRISFLHEPNMRKFSLNLDISEIFKPIIIDRSIITLVNKNIIKKDEDFTPVNEGVYLSKTGQIKLIEEIEKRLETKITLYKDQKMSYKNLIRYECYKLIKHLKDEEVYKPYKL
ncbi:type I-B CRISPR-associated endonuclease Cas1b [Marinitoga litoralis]|uniref:type I-B CRISPR-associated endonuclease Cas1b n=1 Tax=Marinitoga litoralis TaxID=570855 RepID=UPI001961466F|nr:type I-B CRISPR-associated endonuclease Cas1b [Marinitoga litoralis]MBM7560027.1 CRISPR-associated protein Cas1 [Marinitoga litoralis]